MFLKILASFSGFRILWTKWTKMLSIWEVEWNLKCYFLRINKSYNCITWIFDIKFALKVSGLNEFYLNLNQLFYTIKTMIKSYRMYNNKAWILPLLILHIVLFKSKSKPFKDRGWIEIERDRERKLFNI
jgi:hypothetical protein